MEMEKMSSIVTSKEEDDDVPLPGFRFHPTDQELVSFYLRRKIEKRPISIELIKQVDIYKYDPWDLPKASINVGDKEWYFFCKRGRKYRNSVRPNRVTGSGFWKATGIDKPIYSTGGEGRDCIGLKKSLVFYRGSAGKGTKTDWMMHEFRLPSDHDKSTKHFDAKTIAQEAEVWTLCRIFKRNVSYKKSIPDWKEIEAKRSPVITVSSKTTTTCDMAEYSDCNTQSYISFDAPSHVIRQNNNNNNRPLYNYIEKKPLITGHHVNLTNQLQLVSTQLSSVVSQQQPPSAASSYSGFMNPDVNDILKHGDWDDLRSVVEFAADPLLF